jgi:AcrR family transcriptional regulator
VQIGEAQARGMIIQGGLMVFAEKGTRAASVEDILAAGRISRRTFYRLFTGKDDVMLAIYKMGTDRLIDACRAAVASEPDPVKQVHHFVEAHLVSARMLGRIVFVLGGEAARQESPLHAYRMEAHGKLVELLLAKHPDADPLLLRGVLLALEGATRLMLEECDQGRKVTDAAVRRCRAVMLRIATATMVGEGPGVTPVPTRPASP